MPSAVPKKTASASPALATSATETSLERVAGKGPYVTLQNVVMPLQGVCTEPGLFYNLEGRAWVSETQGVIFLAPEARLRTDTFFNMVGLGHWHRLCRLDGLFLALKGGGQVEVQVFQVQTGHSKERLACEVLDLSPEAEAVLDLSHHMLNAPAGGLWFEVRNCSDSVGATLTSARYLTRGTTGKTAMRLALCLSPRDGDDAARLRLESWASGAGQAVGAAVLAASPGTSALAQLAAAKAQGFSHAVVMDPSTIVAPETLGRIATFLSLARDASAALGATVLDPAEKFLVAANGLALDRKEAPAPKFQGLDLRKPLQVVAMECELAEDDTDGLIFQAEFLALSLQDFPSTLSADAGFDKTLRAAGLRAVQPTGLVVNRDAVAALARPNLVTLQNAIYPEAGLCTETGMYFHAQGHVSYSEANGILSLDPRASVLFDSYFNALNVGKWHATCRLEGLFLGLLGRGRVRVKVFHAIPDRSWELLSDAPHTLSPLAETLIDLSHYANTAVTGMIYFEIHAMGPGVQLTGARFATEGRIDGSVTLCLSITTFKREAEVENTARRMAAWFKTADYAAQMHLNIVDNGDSAKIAESDKITRIPNANLGGAGGFTRGLIEGAQAGYSHVLFMDDDASIPMEALHRAYVFLALSKDPKAAVSGAMISNSDKWRMWENGAIFDRSCRPQFNGVDLRDWQQVMQMEFSSASQHSTKMYGGWWFFAFPVKEVAHYPFPFFVRGDDINFSLANDFHITTLNGVVSFAEDFSDKESPMTLYLDLRNHLVQHLTLEKLKIGPGAFCAIGIGFFLRNVAKFQYDTCEALLMAWKDVLKGPEFFAENADAAAPRAAVKAICRQESWKPVGAFDLSERRRFWAGDLGLKRSFFRLTVNGHLLPFFKRWGNRIVVQPRDRNNFRPVWGSARITYLNSTRDKAYTVTQSKLRFLKLSLQLLWLSGQTCLGYGRLLARYRKGYAEIATPSFWRRALNLVKPDQTAATGKQ